MARHQSPGLNGPDPAVLVDLRDATRTFGPQQVLRGVHLQIRAGEFVALLGASGSGKSTLLRALAGLDQRVGGQVLVPQNRAVVFQDARLVPWRRALANVELGADAAERARGRDLLEQVGLADKARAWPKTLSGGEAQRVALARALARSPEVLLLDEPFGALDALTRLRMQVLLADLVRLHHPAVLFVTHDVDEAVRLADRVMVLAEGVIRTDRDVPAEGPDRISLRHHLFAELGVEKRSIPVELGR